MADEVDKGQARGEIATLGTNQYDYEGAQDLGTLGLDSRRVADWRKTRGLSANHHCPEILQYFYIAGEDSNLREGGVIEG